MNWPTKIVSQQKKVKLSPTILGNSVIFVGLARVQLIPISSRAILLAHSNIRMAQILPDQNQDAALLAALRGGEEKAMEAIFRLYYADVCRAVLRIIPTPEIAEDIGQDVLLELWRKKEQIQINTSLAAYLRRAGVNRALNHLRDQKMKFDQDADLEYHSPMAPSFSQELEAEELRQKIEEAIDALPERCRVIFVLSRFEEMSYQKIADTLGISVKTVENQMTKALRILRDKLERFLR